MNILEYITILVFEFFFCLKKNEKTIKKKKMKKILENVFKIVYNSNGNDTDTLKQRRNFPYFFNFYQDF